MNDPASEMPSASADASTAPEPVNYYLVVVPLDGPAQALHMRSVAALADAIARFSDAGTTKSVFAFLGQRLDVQCVRAWRVRIGTETVSVEEAMEPSQEETVLEEKGDEVCSAETQEMIPESPS